jgi:glycosyltransferase involved in cell wall biosynthesis
MAHILIIPGEMLNSENPYPSIFELNFAHALRGGLKIGFISINFEGSIYKGAKRKYQYAYNEEQIDGFPLVEVQASFRTPSFIGFYEYEKVKGGLAAFKRYVDRHGLPDLIHAHSRFLISGLIARSIYKIYGIKYVLTEHSSFWQRNLVSSQEIRSYVKVVNESSHWMVVSKELGEIVEKKIFAYGLKLNKSFEVLPNVVPLEFLTSELKGRSKECFSFLSISSMDGNKNLCGLLEAFAGVCNELKDVNLVLVGNGPERFNLEELAVQLGIASKVIFKGNLTRNQIVEVIECSHVVVSTSLVETFGVVLIEGLALGRPVISTPSGGPASIVTMQNGILCESWDVREIRDAMKSMYLAYDNYDSETIRKDCMMRFGPKSIADILCNIYYQHIQESEN